MKRANLFVIFLLLPFLALAQRTEVSAVVNLPGRDIVGSLPGPSFKESVEGVVVVQVMVDQYGNVTEATPGVEGTTITHTALWNATRSAAMKAHFNISADAPIQQTGTIAYKLSKVQSENASSEKETVDENAFPFLGIPIDGSRNFMINQLIAKGFELTRYEYLTGQFNGEPVRVYVHTYHDKVDRIAVIFEPSPEMDLREQYNNLLSSFEKNKKYRPITKNLVIPDDELFYWSNKKYKARYEAVATGSRKIAGEVWFAIVEQGGYRVGLYYDNLKNRPHGEDL